MGATLQRGLAGFYGYDEKKCYEYHSGKKCIVIKDGYLYETCHSFHGSNTYYDVKIRINGTIACITKDKLVVFFRIQRGFVKQEYDIKNDDRLILPGNRVLHPKPILMRAEQIDI